MFYKNQPQDQRDNYKKMLAIIGSLTRLFSENSSPYLPYRIHENVFCKYFEADNLARFDCSADAKKGKLGIGLKTWVGGNDQKIAEFGRLKENYANLTGLELVTTISEYRNTRIKTTKKLHGLEQLVYHVAKREPEKIQILEYDFDYIHTESITVLDRGNHNNTYFTDNINTYHFSTSKNTLYKIFGDAEAHLLDCIHVHIMDDPYQHLMDLANKQESIYPTDTTHIKSSDINNQLCLRLYSTKGDTKFVPERSGLNQWNARGRSRDPNEIYIPYPAEDKKENQGFFPPRDTIFDLQLPDGTHIPAKVCQDGDKAIMSNPNKILGEWLLRNVFELPEGTLVTYEMLEIFDIDSVVFTKKSDRNYAIDFATVGTYEDFQELKYGKETS